MRSLAALAGLTLVLGTWSSVFRTVFVQQGPASRATRWSFRVIGLTGIWFARRLPGRLSGRYVGLQAPVVLFLTAGSWLGANTIGFAVLAWALYGIPFHSVNLENFFQWHGPGMPLAALAWLSTALLLAAFTTHLVWFVDAYLRRERPVVRLLAQTRELPDAESVLADQLASDQLASDQLASDQLASDQLASNQVSGGSREELNTLFSQWADWLAEIEYSQGTYPALVFVRSNAPIWWVEAAVIMLDAAALTRAVAPSWAPPSSQTLVETGSRCLQLIAGQLGLQLRPTMVSLHGREERRFTDTYQYVIDSGVPDLRDERQAWVSFQASRTHYAPHAAAISQQLHCHFNVTGGQPTSGLRIASDHS